MWLLVSGNLMELETIMLNEKLYSERIMWNVFSHIEIQNLILRRWKVGDRYQVDKWISSIYLSLSYIYIYMISIYYIYNELLIDQ